MKRVRQALGMVAFGAALTCAVAGMHYDSYWGLAALFLALIGGALS